jgi:prolipoprotein diacylglyceryltransferase
VGAPQTAEGIERFFIEKIRVNTKYDIFGFHPTQAELISAALVISGVILFARLRRKAAHNFGPPPSPPPPPPSNEATAAG